MEGELFKDLEQEQNFILSKEIELVAVKFEHFFIWDQTTVFMKCMVSTFKPMWLKFLTSNCFFYVSLTGIVNHIYNFKLKSSTTMVLLPCVQSL